MRNGLRLTVHIVSTTLAFTVACALASGFVGVAVTLKRPVSAVVYSPRLSVESGDELVLVYIGASTCGASNVPELPGIVERIKVALKAEAGRRKLQLLVTGVAKDVVSGSGLRHLQKFGTFDETVAGNGWLNSVARHYVVDAFPGLRATPQLVLTVRQTRVDVGGPSVSNERLLARKIGVSEIKNWLELGVPVPPDLFSGETVRLR